MENILLGKSFDSSLNPTVLHTELPLPSAVKQVDGLQVLRAFAVVIVCWAHVDQFFIRISGQSLPNLRIFGIDVFFVISGFILSLVVFRSRRSAGVPASWEFFKRRLIRIYPIYWIFCVVGIVFLVHHHQHPGWGQVVGSVFLLPFVHYPRWLVVVDFSWTLVFEMFFYFMLAVVQLVTVRRAVVTVIALQCILVGVGHFISICRPVLIVACNPMVLEFIFGAIIALVFDAYGQRRKVGISLAVLGSVAAILLSTFNVTSPPEQWILIDRDVLFRVFTWGIAAACLVGGVVLWLPNTNNRLGKLMVTLGNASYSTYVASSFVIYFSTKLAESLLRHKHWELSLGLHVIFQTSIVCIAMLIGWVIYQLVEFPLLRALQRALVSKPIT